MTITRFWKYTGGAFGAVALSVVGLVAAGAFASPPAAPATPSTPTQTSDTVDNRSAETVTYNVVHYSFEDVASGCTTMDGEQIAIIDNRGEQLGMTTLGSPQSSDNSCTYTAIFDSVDVTNSITMQFPTPTDTAGVEVEVGALAQSGWTVNASIGTPGD